MPTNEEKLRGKVEEQRARIQKIHADYERLRKDLAPFGGLEGVRKAFRELGRLRGRLEEIDRVNREG